MSGTILIVDDHAEQAAVIRELAEGMGHRVVDTTDPRQAVALFTAHRPDLIVLDVVMPDMDGFDVLKALGAAGCAVPVLLVSGFNPRYLEDAAKLAGLYGIRALSTMAKPLRIDALRSYIAAQLGSS